MTAIQKWTEPVAMESGAPEPATLLVGQTLWVAYRARDPAFPGWGHPATDAYLENAPEGEPFGVLRFDVVQQHQLGAPDEDRLHDHPLWGNGLDYYSFHRIDADDGVTRWIVTFHDETLDVTATSAVASPLIFASNQLDAIAKMRGTVVG